MRIIFVSPFYKPYLGGVERVIEKLGQEFVKSGHEVAILTTKYSFPRNYHSDWSGREVIDGLHVRRINSWPHKALPFYQVPLVWFSPLETRRMINDVRPDVVIYMGDKWFWGNFLTRVLSQKAKHIWCPIFHNLSFWKQWLRPINWVFAKMINDVIVATNIEGQKVQKAYGVKKEKTVAIPWGVDCRDVRDKLAQPEINAGRARSAPISRSNRVGGEFTSVAIGSVVKILSVGRISKHKGQLWLVEMFLGVVKQTAVPCQLILVGEVEDQEIYDQIKALASGVEEGRIIIDTKADDHKLRQYYQECDIFALFPQYESFGLVYIEAMGYGLPVITHKVGAIEEVLKDAAILAAPYDEKLVTASLLQMINDVVYRKDLGAKGEQFVRQNYSWEKCGDEFLKLIL